jgi:cytochrome P450
MLPWAQINYYAMQNVAANFAEPQRFWPERWLAHARAGPLAEANLGGEQDPLARAFLPYSAGPRSCIGQPLAQMEARPCMAAPGTRAATMQTSWALALRHADHMGSGLEVMQKEWQAALLLISLWLPAAITDELHFPC